MRIAAAQMSPKAGDIMYNLHEHYRLIGLAAENGVKLIAFPEMSITGYIRESAESLALTETDPRIDKLRNLAAENDIIIIAGAPIKTDSALHIGSFILFPDGSLSIYTKQFLHAGEEEFFTPCLTNNPMINVENERISLAICADITNPIHPENAHKSHCTIYIASIFYTPGAMAEAFDLLSNYAKTYAMNVLMANFCGETWGKKAGGKSALWSSEGRFIAGLDDASSGLVIGDINQNEIAGKQMIL